MYFTQIVAFVLAGVGSASAICADGQIGIGAEQLSGIGTPGAFVGVIWANNCGEIASNIDNGPCGGDYNNGASVQWLMVETQRKSCQREDWRRDFVDLRRWWGTELRRGAVWCHLSVDLLQPRLKQTFCSNG
ncbi:hypothetical protein B0H14DRAFT_2568614 [Mycena olivaceomarginata]|nr:hypothetical protein B0H14DRAFT_2568614 [Mycena olivaceomarginata]